MFEIKPVKDYECVICIDERDYDILATLDGVPKGPQWAPIAVQRAAPDADSEARASDFPFLSSRLLVLRTSAVVALRDLLDRCGELLPLATDDGVQLSVFNARAVDALDEERSSIVRFSASKRIMQIKQIAFHEAAIRDLDILRLPHRGSFTYVSERFVERVRTAGLKGLDFRRVWPL